MRTSAAAAEKHAAARASRAALRSWATPIPPVPPLVIDWAPPREFSAYPYHSPLSERPPSELNHSRDPRRECLRDPYPYPWVPAGRVIRLTPCTFESLAKIGRGDGPSYYGYAYG